MRLGFLVTARCNASCTHCSTSCGPQRTETLSPERICALMDDAAALSEDPPLEFLLSGGEPFLDFAALLQVLAHGKRLNAVMTCVTNGSWATSADKARQMLTQVRDAGLSQLAVSYSPFHRQFVKPQRIERVFAAAREIGLPCTLKYVRSNSDPRSPEEIRTWAEAAGADDVEELPLLPHLREGARLPDSEFPRTRSEALPLGRCPAPTLTIREDGHAYTCCTPGGFTPLLSLGEFEGRELREIRDRFYLGGLQQILRTQGPAHFAQAARERGLGHRLRGAYDGVCDLCTHLAADPELAKAAAQAAEEFEVRQVQDLLEQLLQPDPAA